MRRVPVSIPLAAAILTAGVAAWGQSAPGAIQGVVLDANGKPISRAAIYYGRAAQSKAKAAGSVLPPVLTARSGPDGSFTLPELPPGRWIVCVVAPGFLDPCHWAKAPSFNVVSAKTASNANIRLDQTYSLRIHVNDPQSYLANEGEAAGALLQIGAHAPSGAFHYAVLTAKDATGRDYALSIPAGAAARVFVSGGAFQLKDDTGSQVPKGGKVAQVTAPDPAKLGATPPATLNFTVTGIEKP